MLKQEDILEHPTYKDSHELVKSIASKITTFHHHFHILYPLLHILQAQHYLEIGSYLGASLCLASHAPSIRSLTAIDTCEVVSEQKQAIEANVRAHGGLFKDAHVIARSSSDRTLLKMLYQGENGGFTRFQSPPFVDVLLIDGAHDTASVIQDYKNYFALVRPGGVIVFDDDGDNVYCPGVACGVQQSVTWSQQNNHRINVIGVLPNKCHAFANGVPSLEHRNNEFIIQKPLLPLGPRLDHNNHVLFGIVMATYQRKTGTTPAYFRQAVSTIKNQSHPFWQLFVVGDNYEDEKEFVALMQETGLEADGRIVYVNLPIACEREHIHDPTKRWYSAGATAMNYAINLIALNGIRYVAHLDDDDRWMPNHLSCLAQAYENASIDPSFVYARSQFMGRMLPSMEENVTTLSPRSSNLTHSSASWRVDRIPLRYRTGDILSLPADADMWERIRTHCTAHHLTTHFTCETTVVNDGERMSS